MHWRTSVLGKAKKEKLPLKGSRKTKVCIGVDVWVTDLTVLRLLSLRKRCLLAFRQRRSSLPIHAKEKVLEPKNASSSSSFSVISSFLRSLELSFCVLLSYFSSFLLLASSSLCWFFLLASSCLSCSFFWPGFFFFFLTDHIKFAKEKGVEMMTFDNVAEVEKIMAIFPAAKLVLRILSGKESEAKNTKKSSTQWDEKTFSKFFFLSSFLLPSFFLPSLFFCVDDSHSLCPFGTKFGASIDESKRLIELCRKLNANLIGIRWDDERWRNHSSCNSSLIQLLLFGYFTFFFNLLVTSLLRITSSWWRHLYSLLRIFAIFISLYSFQFASSWWRHHRSDLALLCLASTWAATVWTASHTSRRSRSSSSSLKRQQK